MSRICQCVLKIIPSWVRKVLGIAKTNLPQGTVCGVVISVTLLVYSLCLPFRLVIWPVFLGQLDTIFLCISLQFIKTRIWFSMISWDLVKKQLVGKCQTQTYLWSCRYVWPPHCSSPYYWANSYPSSHTLVALHS